MAGYIGSRAAVVSNGAERKKTYAITGTTTSLTGLNYTVSQVHVFHNGVRLVDGTDFTATNGNSITLTTAAEDGDEVVVISYATYQTSDTVSASVGGTFSGDIEIDGDLTVDTDTLHVDSTNNRVGIGTTSPEEALHLETSGVTAIKLDGTSDGAAMISSSYGILNLEADADDENSASYIRFLNHGDEAARIDNSGNLLVGTATAGYTSQQGVTINGTSASYQSISHANGVASGNSYVLFSYNGGLIGSIVQSGTTSVGYNTTSDYRLKENVADVTDGITRVKQLAPKRFNFIADPDTTVDGFLAHEAQTVVPEAVTGTHNETQAIGDITDGDGNTVETGVVEPNTLEEGHTWTETGTQPVYQGIDQSKLVPLLTAALQEAIAKIETLETEMTSVKSRLDALEAN